VPDDRGATPIGERVEQASERRTQGCRVLCDELGIRTAQCIELAASCLLVRFAPAFFSPGAQACLDDDSPRDPLAERGEKTGERLGRTLRTRGDEHAVAAAQTRSDLGRRAHAVRSRPADSG
jgi:hypothetical protein